MVRLNEDKGYGQANGNYHETARLSNYVLPDRPDSRSYPKSRIIGNTIIGLFFIDGNLNGRSYLQFSEQKKLSPMEL